MTAFLMVGACAAPPDLEARDAWAREAASSSTAVYVAIANRGGSDDSLMSVATDRGVAGLHVTQIDNGIARMRAVPKAEGLAVPAGGELQLKPGGAHVMLTGLTQPLRAGETVPMRLIFQKSPPLSISVTVRPAGEVGHGSH